MVNWFRVQTMVQERIAKEHRYHIPSRHEIEGKLKQLVDNDLSREELASWAIEYSLYENDQIYPKVDDPVVWSAIVLISGADLRESENNYLHNKKDFEIWLAEFREKCEK